MGRTNEIDGIPGGNSYFLCLIQLSNNWTIHLVFILVLYTRSNLTEEIYL